MSKLRSRMDLMESKRLPPTLQKVVDFLKKNPDRAFVDMATGGEGKHGQGRRWWDVTAYDRDAPPRRETSAHDGGSVPQVERSQGIDPEVRRCAEGSGRMDTVPTVEGLR